MQHPGCAKLNCASQPVMASLGRLPQFTDSGVIPNHVYPETWRHVCRVVGNRQTLAALVDSQAAAHMRAAATDADAVCCDTHCAGYDPTAVSRSLYIPIELSAPCAQQPLMPAQQDAAIAALRDDRKLAFRCAPDALPALPALVDRNLPLAVALLLRLLPSPQVLVGAPSDLRLSWAELWAPDGCWVPDDKHMNCAMRRTCQKHWLSFTVRGAVSIFATVSVTIAIERCRLQSESRRCCRLRSTWMHSARCR